MRSRCHARAGLVIAAIAAASAAGCQMNKAADERSAPVGSVAASRVAPAVDAISRTPASGESPASRQITPQDTATFPAMIIRTGNASLLVDSLEQAIARVTLLAQRLGGWVSNTSMQTGPDQVRSATLTLKIPANRYDEAVGGLQPIGDLETVHTTAEDVGEEFVDVTARVSNARRLEDRLVALLASRTGKLDDVLAVERELARIREEIERFQGRLRFLRSRVAISTLTVTVHEEAPLLGSNPSANLIGDAFVAAWRNFVGLVALFIASLGWLLPLALIALTAIGIGRRRNITWLKPRGTPPQT
jgi:hypothetical protein